MRAVRRAVPLLIAGALLLAAPGAASAAGTRAVLAGRGIPLQHVARYHCHDGAHPMIRCFTGRAARDRDARRLAVVYYVRIFEHEQYGGSSFTISTSITNLGSQGWNDRVTSFKSLNGGHPKFWEHTGYTGTAWQWPTGAWVANVGPAANDRFSSVKNVP